MNAPDRKPTAAKTAQPKAAAKAVKAKAESTFDRGVEVVSSAASGFADSAEAAAANLREEASQRMQAGKDIIAEQGKRVASGLRDVAATTSDLQGRLLDTIATGVSDVSENLRGRSLSGLVQDAEGFAKRNPGLLMAGAALAGFALGRLALGSGRSNEDDDADEAPAPRTTRAKSTTRKSEPKS